MPATTAFRASLVLPPVNRCRWRAVVGRPMPRGDIGKSGDAAGAASRSLAAGAGSWRGGWVSPDLLQWIPASAAYMGRNNSRLRTNILLDC